MKNVCVAVFAVGLVVMVAGCASSGGRIVGHDVTRTATWFGDVGIAGDNNNLTLLDGSRVIKLSITGDDNNITVEDGAIVNRISFWGHGNTVSIPGYLMVRSDEVGRNQIIRRQKIDETVVTDWDTQEQIAVTEYNPTPTVTEPQPVDPYAPAEAPASSETEYEFTPPPASEPEALQPVDSAE